MKSGSTDEAYQDQKEDESLLELYFLLYVLLLKSWARQGHPTKDFTQRM